MPPTTGGSTSGRSTNERSSRTPGTRLRAKIRAIGTPSTTHSTVLASAVFRLSHKAARDDSDVSSDRKSDHGTLTSTATRGSSTNSAPSKAGTWIQLGSPVVGGRGAGRRSVARGPVSGSAEGRITQHLLALGSGDVVLELTREGLLPAGGQDRDRVGVHGRGGF